MTTLTIEERVAKGAAFLDEQNPGWRERIDLDLLNIAASDRCILGQLHGDFGVGMMVYKTAFPDDVIFRWVRELGFQRKSPYTGEVPNEYPALNDAWHKELTAA